MKAASKVKKGMAGLAVVVVLMMAGAVRWNTVKEVIDGDTIRLGNGQKVRLVGIDAPEMELCGGGEAKDKLEKTVLGKRVRLAEVKADQYGRVLALVYQGDRTVNEEMIKSGWARWDGTENGLGTRMALLSDEAREKERGVFGICRQPVKEGCVVKGNIEKRSGLTEGGRKIYFFPGCSEYEAAVVERELGEEWFCTEAEAVGAGYVKGGNCFGKTWQN